MCSLGARAADSLNLYAHAIHGGDEGPGIFRPSCGKDAGRAAERVDAEAGIVRERGETGRAARGLGLDHGIGGEGGAGFVRLGESESGR